MDTLISVIIPVYNAQKYLRKCLESVISQTYTNLQIIVVNDGSTDNSRKICEEFAKKDCRIELFHQGNRGVAVARNNGLARARGSYIIWVDADDYISERFVEVLYSIAMEENADIVQCLHMEVFYDDAEFIINTKNKYINPQIVLEEYLQDEYQNISIYLWDKFVKRELYTGLSFSNRTNSEERTIIYRLLQRSKRYIRTEANIYAYRLSEVSLTRGEIGINYVQSGIEAEKERLAYFMELKDEKLLDCARIGFCKVMVMSYCRWKKYVSDDAEQLDRIFGEFKRVYLQLNKKKLSIKNKCIFLAFYLNPFLYYSLVFGVYECRKKRKEKNG